MSKAFFRFLRGELNGFYLTRINGAMNDFTTDVKDFLAEFNDKQLEYGKIDKKSLYGLGKFAGIFLPRISVAESVSSLRMAESHIEDGFEFSESGLFDIDFETFQFVTSLETFEDINSHATEALRSSMVGEEQLIGYISSEERNVIDDEGNVRADKVLSYPPSDVAYSDYYGDQFLFLSEAESSYANLEPSLYIELFKAMQWVRYNGISVESLCKIIKTICPEGLVTIDRIETAEDRKRLFVYYNYDSNVQVYLKQQRLSLLEYIVKIKFIQVALVENT